MADILDNYINKVNKLEIQKKVERYYDAAVAYKDKFLKLIVMRFEVLKIKFELKKNYIELGQFVSKSYSKEKTVDFSYKEDFFSLNHDIKKNIRYINKIKSYYKQK
ncbi:MAG: hypothetical protein CMG66_03675 [Candidatus Marinimicrobia bacterium]|nr:hypothetical protein [Candidatus Neomarinimicrobiota bacterium]|tara:strand:- start:24114 stop:24431 length:318 start_codon:yes stop_codon:yes gene_type:complete